MRTGYTVLGSCVLAAVVVAGGACGDDDGGDQATAVTVTVGADGIGVPDSIDAGPVEVTIDGADLDNPEVDFTKVATGTSEEAFVEMISGVVEGGPIPDALEANAGVISGTGVQTILLDSGDYFVWAEGPDGILAAPTTVTGDGGGDLADTDGTITARDFGFDVDVAAGESFTFRNDGPNELHHAVLVDFGDADPAVVEENFAELVSADEGAPPPEALADTVIDFEVGGSGVFTPGLSGTFAAPLESGHTYAVVCFISDRAGGAPHAIEYDMWEVFQVS